MWWNFELILIIILLSAGRLIAKEMVKMMAIDPDKLDLPESAKDIKLSKDPCLFTKSWKFLDLVPDTFPDTEQEES